MTASLKYTYTNPKALYIEHSSAQLSFPVPRPTFLSAQSDGTREPPTLHDHWGPLLAGRRLTFFPVTFDFWMDFTLMIGRSGCIEKV